MCSCTLRRSSAISRCASLESNWVSANEVTPWMQVAASTPSTSGPSRPAWCFPMTLSTSHLVEAGKAMLATLLTIMSRKPSASSPRRGRTSSLIRGQALRR